MIGGNIVRITMKDVKAMTRKSISSVMIVKLAYLKVNTFNSPLYELRKLFDKLDN